MRSALVEALDLSQQSLCTTAGHDRLLGLLRGGDGGAVEALTRALVGAIEHNNDRRVRPLCALAARTLTSWPSAALAAVRAARRAGVDAIVARLEHTVVDLTIHSCDILSELEDALRFEPRGSSARLHTVSDERFWSAIDERDADDLASPRDGVGRLLLPVGRAEVLTGLPCPTCGAPLDDHGTATPAHAGFRCTAVNPAPRRTLITTARRTSAVHAGWLTRSTGAWLS